MDRTRYPKAIRTPEFTGKALDQWAYRRDIKLTGKPTQNAFIVIQRQVPQ